MEYLREVTTGDRVLARCTAPFQLFWEFGEERVFAGPHSADLRITSCSAPRGATAVIMVADADAQYELTVMPNRFTTADPESLVKELEHDQPQALRDIVANTIAEMMSRQKLTDSEPETIEEANDFEIDDLEWTEDPWIREVIDEVLEPLENPQREPEPVNTEQPAEATEEPPAVSSDSPEVANS